MKFLNAKSQTTGEEVKLSYCDYGAGQPVVLIHGWPSSKEMWEYQVDALVNAGYRVVKYDRRGFGKSDKPWDGYDYDTFADDLNAVMEQLDLANAVLVGFSMGGGEVVRYLSRYGSNRVAKIALVSSVTPFLMKTDDNPDGIDQSVFEEILTNIKTDRMAFLDDFGKQFFGVNMLNHPVSTPFLENFRNLAAVASNRSTTASAVAWSTTDFRSDVEAITVPTLIIHGDSDKTVPMQASADRVAAMLPNARYLIYSGEPHGLIYTAKEQFNEDLIDFISSDYAVINSDNVVYADEVNATDNATTYIATTSDGLYPGV